MAVLFLNIRVGASPNVLLAPVPVQANGGKVPTRHLLEIEKLFVGAVAFAEE
jgi:hypothetical protein